jgi:threonine dehydrogenase-like Zn-dependent dehydrogenase|tara:strand:+ start:36 stop:977 length:942 start_codon:yes stop_codon:yes gene_type:complete
MKAVSYADGKVKTSNIKKPIGDGVVVNVSSAGICGSDLHLLNSGAHSPHIAGHEISGITENGKHVAIEPIIPCSKCDDCYSGNYHLCKNNSKGMGMSINGGMTEQMIVPESCLIELDSRVPVQDACLVEPLAVAIHGFVKTKTKNHHRIAVIGGGTIGICTIAAARYLGCKVDLYAKYDHQIEAGLKLGAGELNGQYDRVIDCVGNDDTLKLSVNHCKPGSWLVLLGIPLKGINLPGLKTIMNEIKVLPSIMYSSTDGVKDFEIAAKVLAKFPNIGKTIITHRFSLEESEEAFRVAADKTSESIKVIFDPNIS